MAPLNGIRRTSSQQIRPESLSKFSEGISLSLSRWHALQLAVQNEWGGRDSPRKSKQLASDILTWFSQSNVPRIDDLENMLDETMVLSFNTDIEDGSIEEVAEELMIMHEDCVQGNYETIEKLRKSNAKAETSSQNRQCEVVDKEDDKRLNKSLMLPEMSRDEQKSREAATPEDLCSIVATRRNRGLRSSIEGL